MITDVGFVKLIKIIIHVQVNHAPNLNYLCLKNNPISGQIRVQYMPLPSYVSL